MLKIISLHFDLIAHNIKKRGDKMLDGATWKVVLIGSLGDKETIIDSGLPYNKAVQKMYYLRKSRLDRTGTVIVKNDYA